jgi:hypothetical protein
MVKCMEKAIFIGQRRSIIMKVNINLTKRKVMEFTIYKKSSQYIKDYGMMEK